MEGDSPSSRGRLPRNPPPRHLARRPDQTSAFQRAQIQSKKALQTPRASLAQKDQTKQEKCLSTCPNTIQKGASNIKGFSRPSRPDQTRQVPFNVPKHNPKRHFKHNGILIATFPKTEDQTKHFKAPWHPFFGKTP